MKQLLIVTTTLLALFGCSTKVDQLQLKQVQSIAVVGFSVFQQSDGNPLQLLHKHSESDAETEHLATDFYHGFVKTLGSKMSVSHVPMKDIVSNPYYQTLYKKYSDVDKLIIDMGKTYRAENMLSGQAIFDMTQSERNSLAKALNVDSVIGVESILYEGASHGISIGNIGVKEVSFRVTVSEFEQYNVLNKEPIVDITNLVGDTPDEDYTSYGVVFNDELFGVNKPKRKALIAAVSEVASNLVEEITSSN